MYTGLNADSPKHLLLDAGAFFLNYDLTKSYSAQTTAVCLGATSGGGSFSAVPQVRKIALDGAKTNVVGLATIDGWTVSITAKCKELTKDSLVAALGAATSATVPSGDTRTAVIGYTEITGKADIESTDYADNLTWVGRLKGSNDPVIIVIDNALDENGLSITVADKAEATFDVTVMGNYALTDLDTPPFAIFYPTLTA